MIEQMSDYVKGRTTITSRTEKVSELEPPTMTLCLDPALKTSVAQEFGFSIDDDLFYKDVPTLPFPQRFEKLSYILNQDFELAMDLNYHDSTEVIEGIVTIDDQPFEIDHIQTMGHGTCIKIQPQFVINSPLTIGLYVKFLDMNESDKPKQLTIYLTSNNTWQSIVTNEWPQFSPTKISIDINSYHFISAKPKEYLFHQGIESSEDCWSKSIQDFNCTTKCQFASIADLPLCETIEEVECILNQAENLFTICNQKKTGLVFDGELVRLNKHKQDNVTTVYIDLVSMSKKIEEEVDMITMAGLIGSVGGSLGMFFGFAISACLLDCLDKRIDKVMLL